MKKIHGVLSVLVATYLVACFDETTQVVSPTENSQVENDSTLQVSQTPLDTIILKSGDTVFVASQGKQDSIIQALDSLVILLGEQLNSSQEVSDSLESKVEELQSDTLEWKKHYIEGFVDYPEYVERVEIKLTLAGKKIRLDTLNWSSQDSHYFGFYQLPIINNVLPELFVKTYDARNRLTSNERISTSLYYKDISINEHKTFVGRSTLNRTSLKFIGETADNYIIQVIPNFGYAHKDSDLKYQIQYGSKWVSVTDSFQVDFSQFDEETYLKLEDPTGDTSIVPIRLIKDSRDNKIYQWVEIGSQQWLAKNLNYRGSQDTIGRCVNVDNNCELTGAEYSWREAMDIQDPQYDSLTYPLNPSHQGICPTGWLVPIFSDFDILSKFVLDQHSDVVIEGNALLNAAKYLISSESSKNYGVEGLDTYGFNAVLLGEFFNYANFITSSQGPTTDGNRQFMAVSFNQNANSEIDIKFFEKLYNPSPGWFYGYRLRCFRESVAESSL